MKPNHTLSYLIKDLSEADRFWFYVNKNGPISKLGTNCYIWTGPTTEGYGRFHVNAKPIRAHVYSFKLIEELLKNNIVHHLCEVRLCVRQDHLEQLTRGQHVRKHQHSLWRQ